MALLDFYRTVVSFLKILYDSEYEQDRRNKTIKSLKKLKVAFAKVCKKIIRDQKLQFPRD